ALARRLATALAHRYRRAMSLASSSRRGLGSAACALLLACGTDIATGSVGLSGGETGDESTGMVLDTSGAHDSTVSADETGGGESTGNSSVDATGPDPSDGTDDGGIGGEHC